MHKSSKEAYEICEIGIIDDKEYFWVKVQDLERQSDYKNWPVTLDKCDLKKQKYRCELKPNT